MKLQALKGGTRRLDIVFAEEDGFGEGSMFIEYRPGELTFDAIEQMTESARQQGGEAEAILGMFSAILVDWDLEDEDEAGNTYRVPPTREGIRQVPLPALGFFFSKVMDDVRPNPPKDGSSEDGSAPEEPSETQKSLIGTS